MSSFVFLRLLRYSFCWGEISDMGLSKLRERDCEFPNCERWTERNANVRFLRANARLGKS